MSVSNTRPTIVRYRCGVCGVVVENRDEARIHAKIHTGMSFEQVFPDAVEAATPSDSTKTK